ncbi:MAG TPA: hypothetical protein VF159_10100, partial [Gemmatimonadaceae bacterium]
MSPTRHAEPRRHAARVASGAALSALALVAGCGAPMEIFSDASDSASRVTHLAWFLIILSAIVYAGVMLAMVLGFRRHRDRLPNSVDLTERGTGWIIFGGAVMPAAVLL